MLFIRNYDKFSLDRSSTSIVDYYRQLLGRINFDIMTLRDDLLDLLSQVRALRTDLIAIKNEIQEILNEDRELARQLGYTSSEFDAIQEILDDAEEELEDLEKDIESTINRIDCSEIPDICNYTDYTDCSETNEEPEPEESCTYDIGTCVYCSYGSGTSEPVSGCDEYTVCAVCNHDECAVDMSCNESCIYNSSDINPGTCAYSEIFNPDCGETTGTNGKCGETMCMHYCDQQPIVDGCSFTCYHHSTCNELEIPDNCSYNCTDAGCNYNYGCSECDYTSEWCGECDFNDCTFHDENCDYDSNGDCSYDNTCGFDYGCDEFNCNEGDCSEDCGDCGQDCSEQTCEAGDDYDPSCDECDI